MGKILYKDREFEKNKKEILKRMMMTNSNLAIKENGIDIKTTPCHKVGSRKYAWEYEIEEYRKKKNLERFYKIGALSGILSLVITIADKFFPIRELTYTAINNIIK